MLTDAVGQVWGGLIRPHKDPNSEGSDQTHRRSLGSESKKTDP
jgi:hypothetical protein